MLTLSREREEIHQGNLEPQICLTSDILFEVLYLTILNFIVNNCLTLQHYVKEIICLSLGANRKVTQRICARRLQNSSWATEAIMPSGYVVWNITYIDNFLSVKMSVFNRVCFIRELFASALS